MNEDNKYCDARRKILLCDSNHKETEIEKC